MTRCPVVMVVMVVAICGCFCTGRLHELAADTRVPGVAPVDIRFDRMHHA
jgi:hypothetical protein